MKQVEAPIELASAAPGGRSASTKSTRFGRMSRSFVDKKLLLYNCKSSKSRSHASQTLWPLLRPPCSLSLFVAFHIDRSFFQSWGTIFEGLMSVCIPITGSSLNCSSAMTGLGTGETKLDELTLKNTGHFRQDQCQGVGKTQCFRCLRNVLQNCCWTRHSWDGRGIEYLDVGWYWKQVQEPHVVVQHGRVLRRFFYVLELRFDLFNHNPPFWHSSHLWFPSDCIQLAVAWWSRL